MPNWGPVSVSIGPGTVTPDGRAATLLDSGTVPVGTLTQVSGTCSVSFTGGRSDAAWGNRATSFNPAGDQIDFTSLSSSRLTTTTASWSYNVPLGTARVLIEATGALYQGQTMTFVANGNTSTTTYCAYGSHTKSGGPITVVASAANILAWLEVFSAQALAAVFNRVVGTVIDVTGLCALPPGQLPAINNAIQDASPDELLQILRVIMWFSLCECIPGTPAPVPFPQPVVTVPGGLATQPTFPCDPADLCASLEAIRAELFSVQQTVSSMAQLVSLLQRYRLPFAYIPGAVHSNLTGAGGFQVSRLLGVQVVITQKPDNPRVLEGNPPYVWDMGWLSVVNDNGMFEQQRLTRDLQIWLPPDMPQAGSFQWWLHDGVTIRVTELEAEP